MPTLMRDGQRVAYEVLGSGPEVVVLAHNLMAQRGSFAAVAGALAKRARVLAIDLRGHGESVPSPRAFTVADLADDLLALLDAEGVSRALIVGTSLGASAAMMLALRYPSRVRGLVLISATPHAATWIDRLRFGALAAVLRGLGPGPVMPAIVGQLLGASYRRQPGAVAAVTRWIRATPRSRSGARGAGVGGASGAGGAAGVDPRVDAGGRGGGGQRLPAQLHGGARNGAVRGTAAGDPRGGPHGAAGAAGGGGRGDRGAAGVPGHIGGVSEGARKI